MSKTKEALRRAQQLCELIAETPHSRGSINGLAAQVQHEIEAALAEPEQEPVAFMNPYGGILSAHYIENFASGFEKTTHSIPLCTSPQPREWQELSEEQSLFIFKQVSQTVEKHGFKTRYIAEPNFPSIEKAISAALRANNEVKV